MKNVKIFVSDLNQFLRRELKELRFDRYVYWLCMIFTAVFLNTIFIMNDLNSSVLGSISADHASMFESMKMILSTSGLYNMHEGYHSSFYGWTYFFFSFWLLLPVKILFSLWEADTAIPIFIGLKTLHFFYGLLAAISFYYLARRFFNKIVSFGAAFILTFATSLTEYNYLFHPETIGVFFLNLACIYLIDFARGKNKESDREIYYWAILLFLVLCTLAKPTFFLITAPLYICLFTLTLKQKNIILNSTIAFKNSLKILRKTILFSLSVFFIIHPFFFVLIHKSIEKQLHNIETMGQSPLALDSFASSFFAWTDVIKLEPLLIFSFMASFVFLLFTLLIRNTSERRFYYSFIALCTLLNIAFTIDNFRLFISTNYFIPILPFLVLFSFATINYLLNFLFKSEGLKTVLLLTVLAFLSFTALQTNAKDLKDFYGYKEKTHYKVYTIIKTELPDNIVILHDHLVGIPDKKNIKAYHYWQTSPDDLKNVKADYIIFAPELKFNNKYQDGTLILRSRTQEGNYKKIRTIDNIEFWKRK